MVIYHSAWFASDYGLIDLDISHSLPWRIFQKSIASTFFILVGVGLSLAVQLSLSPRRYLRRLAKIVGCAAVVTATSAVLDPARLTTFGILHAIAVCSVLALPAAMGPGWLAVLLGLPMIAAGAMVRHPLFDHPALGWVGLSTTVAPTFDHQPLLPWLGVVLLGVALGERLPRLSISRWAGSGRLPRWLARAGRHSLLIYMAHVPAIVAVVEIAARW